MRLFRRSWLLVVALLCAPAVVVSSPAPADAAVVPGRIVFARSSGIWITGSSGANPVQLTNSADSSPKLSSGGTRIVFTRDNPVAATDPSETIWVMNADGTDQHEVFAPPTATDPHSPAPPTVYRDSEPSWSPDGTKIAFIREGFNTPTGILTMNADGSDPHQVFSTPQIERLGGGLAWSPDGTKIAFAFNFVLGNTHILITNMDGSGGRDLTGNPVSDFDEQTFDAQPAWSPDGTQIAFVGRLTVGGTVGLWVINADGSHPVQLTQNTDVPGDRSPSWSPDLSHIAFERDGRVWTMRADGSQQTNVTAGSSPHWEPMPRLIPGQAWIVEGNDAFPTLLQIPISLVGPAEKTVTASWATLNYTAVAPGDYTAASGTVAFAPGEITKTVSVNINGDTLNEPDELLLVSFTNPTNATIGGFLGFGFGTILDNDPVPTVVPGAASISEGNSGTTTLQIPVSLSAPSGQTVTASWTTLNNTAVAPGDYTAASGTVTFAPGEKTKTVPVTINSDALNEPDELVLVSFTNPTNARIGGYLGLGFGTILNDDPPPTIVPGAASISEGNSGTTTLQIPVSLSAPSGQTVTASWTTLNNTAVAPGDFTAASGTVTFAPGQTTQTVPVTINGDTLNEPDELLIVSLTNPTNATIGGFLGLGFGTIINDD